MSAGTRETGTVTPWDVGVLYRMRMRMRNR